jgi:protein TonB
LTTDKDGWRFFMPFERRTDNGSGISWPRCVVGSALAHLVLLGVCVLVQPSAVPFRPPLRVTLVEDATLPAPIAAVAEVSPARRPAKVVAAPRRAAQPPRPEPAFPVPETLPGVAPAAEPAVPAAPEAISAPSALRSAQSSPPAEQTPAASAPPVVAAVTSAPAVGKDADAPSGASDSRDAEEIRQQSSASGATTPSLASNTEVRGAFYITGSGNGQEPGGGPGTGPRGGPGRGPGAGHGSGNGDGVGRTNGGGAIAHDGGVPGRGAGATDLLSAVRRRIEQAKVYPDTARRQGLQGVVEVRFRIGPDGAVSAVEIVRSSGHVLLDQESADTVRRAAPYPLIPGWIRIPLAYHLAP